MLFHFLSSCVFSDIKVILELFKHCALIFDVTERSLQNIKKILIYLYRRTVSLADTLAPICQIERTRGKERRVTAFFTCLRHLFFVRSI